MLVGCSFESNELKNAERIMDAHPDSALYILQHLKPEIYKSASNHALYGLLLFNALEKNDKKLEPDSLIDFSINYYNNQNDNLHLAACYYYKGHIFKHDQRFDDATVLYLKSLDCIQNKNEYELKGKIYSDLGEISTIQSDYKESLVKFRYSLDYFNRAGKIIDARFIILSIGRTFNNLNDYKTAQLYYHNAISQINDSMLYGATYQEIGGNFYFTKQYDSAQYYLRKSLRFPFKSTGYSIRNFILADLLFDLQQFDSSFIYATNALKFPASSFTQRDCYRILTNIEYTRKDFKQMGIYLRHYQDCSDSVQKIRSQTKCKVLENLHHTTLETKVTKRNMILIVSVMMFILVLSGVLVLYLIKRNKLKREQLRAIKMQLHNKQEFVCQGLSKKIEEARAIQIEDRKNASIAKREKMDKQLYNIALHLDNWDDFCREMNHAFNNIVVILNTEYPTISRREITWCCMHLLDIPLADRILLLDATSDSLYKLKQRLAHKLNLKNTKDLSPFLKDLTSN